MGQAVTHMDIVFDRAPGHDAPRFVEVEDENGRGISVGEWVIRADGLWALRIPRREKVVHRALEAMVVGLFTCPLLFIQIWVFNVLARFMIQAGWLDVGWISEMYK